MPKDDLVYVGQMLDMARKAQQAIKHKNRADYDVDEILRLALTHVVQVIGEAARHVSDEFQQTHPEVPWPVIVGMRHKVVHDYMDVDEDIVWQTVTGDLPELIPLLEAIVPSEPSDDQ
jgi:uncharacterized protein with HEPN domain